MKKRINEQGSATPEPQSPKVNAEQPDLNVSAEQSQPQKPGVRCNQMLDFDSILIPLEDGDYIVGSDKIHEIFDEWTIDKLHKYIKDVSKKIKTYDKIDGVLMANPHIMHWFDALFVAIIYREYIERLEKQLTTNSN